MSSSSTQLSIQSSPSPVPDHRLSPRPIIKPEAAGMAKTNGTGSPINLHKEASAAVVKREGTVASSNLIDTPATPENVNMAERNGTLQPEAEDIKPLNMTSVLRPEVKGHNDRKRRASSDSMDSLQTKASESAADDASKDDEDENDDDDDEKMPHKYDPERLKAFNMFVRLFVDENLDRVVPISKQPKDKIQAILDACDRQFAEFHERSRKRIRTYLKSCRRMRRAKDQNGWDQLRPTPPHLTSAAAESILALACDNESQNAKRMRMGLEPLPPTSTSARSSPIQATLSSALAHPSLSPPQPASLDKQPASASEFPRHTPPAPTAFRPPHELPSPFFSNTNGIFRPGFPSSYQSPAHHHSPVVPHAQLAAQIQNGPTDLSMKKSSMISPSSKSHLNSTEVATIKQLIAGYRESAAFLYRSADELEQLLLHQN